MSSRNASRVPAEVAALVSSVFRDTVAYLEPLRDAPRHRPPDGQGDPTKEDWYRCDTADLRGLYDRLRELYATLRGSSRDALVVRGVFAVTVSRVTGVLAYVTATLSPWNSSSSAHYVHAGRAMSSLNQMRNVLRELGEVEGVESVRHRASRRAPSVR